MKKTIFTLAVATTLMAGTIFTGCQSSDQKIDAAKADVKDAKEDLKEVQQDVVAAAKKVANAEEWKSFKSESEAKIRDAEIRITELKEKIKTSGKTLDALYSQRIDALEEKIKHLKIKMETYEKNQSDWESFKREFNHDMDELGKAFKDLTVDNKK